MVQRTALHSLHIELGAKMGSFAGYDMPLFYPLGVLKEHEWVRQSCGLFDVSHMGQAMVVGPGARSLVEKLTPSSFGGLPVGRTKYSVLTNERGGIIDDLMITHAMDNAYHFVLNAGCKDKDMAWIQSHCPADTKFIYFDEWALLALQGPRAETVLREVMGIDTADMPYMAMRAYEDNNLFISRLGYTGEDGFEIAIKNERAEKLARDLLAHGDVKPIGLAARDSLRLEMGYCLYGHDIDETTTPIEADLSWVMGKANTDFIGAAVVLAQKNNSPARRRVGLMLRDAGVAREGADIQNADGRVIGRLTSGGHSPTLKKSIGMGYVETAFADPGTAVFVNVRGKNLAADIAPLPFLQPRTKAAKAKAA
jgi:aminomethyltransferase